MPYTVPSGAMSTFSSSLRRIVSTSRPAFLCSRRYATLRRGSYVSFMVGLLALIVLHKHRDNKPAVGLFDGVCLHLLDGERAAAPLAAEREVPPEPRAAELYLEPLPVLHCGHNLGLGRAAFRHAGHCMGM